MVFRLFVFREFKLSGLVSFIFAYIILEMVFVSIFFKCFREFDRVGVDILKKDFKSIDVYRVIIFFYSKDRRAIVSYYFVFMVFYIILKSF